MNKAISKAPIAYTAHPNANPQAELNALCAVYRFLLFESRASKEGGPVTAPDDAKKESKHVGAKTRVP